MVNRRVEAWSTLVTAGARGHTAPVRRTHIAAHRPRPPHCGARAQLQATHPAHQRPRTRSHDVHLYAGPMFPAGVVLLAAVHADARPINDQPVLFPLILAPPHHAARRDLGGHCYREEVEG
jgi:hypothetical protein